MATVASLATIDNEAVDAALTADARRGARLRVAVFLRHDDKQTSSLAATPPQTTTTHRLPRTETVGLT